MSSVVPSKDIDALAFFESHTIVWAVAPIGLGLTAAEVTGLDVLTKAARQALSDQTKAKNAAKAATTAWNNAVTAMRNSGGNLVKTIKAFAETTNNPTVFSMAQIPMPAAPTPLPPPGQPTTFTVQLTGTGAVQITWKATNGAASTGAFFVVSRKLVGESVFTNVGNVGTKKFTDSTITQGTTGATYIVQGFRGNQSGMPSEQLSVQFGVSAGGGLVNSQLKMAA